MGFLGFRDGCGGMQPNRVDFEQEKMEGTSDDALWFGHCSTNELGLGCVKDEIDFGWIDLGWWRSRWRCRWASSGDYGCDLADVGCDETGASGVISLLFLFLSFIFLGCNSFEGKIKPEMVLRLSSIILQSTQKTNSVWSNFLYLPNTHTGVKAFPKMVWSKNKHGLCFHFFFQSNE